MYQLREVYEVISSDFRLRVKGLAFSVYLGFLLGVGSASVLWWRLLGVRETVYVKRKG